jgi:hypothetical protein
MPIIDKTVFTSGVDKQCVQPSSWMSLTHPRRLDTFYQHQCCEHSLIELLMMGMGYAPSMYSDLQEVIKYYTVISEH